MLRLFRQFIQGSISGASTAAIDILRSGDLERAMPWLEVLSVPVLMLLLAYFASCCCYNVEAERAEMARLRAARDAKGMV
jgi:hypothetical protein